MDVGGEIRNAQGFDLGMGTSGRGIVRIPGRERG